MKKTFFKAALAVVLILTMILPLAACGNTSAGVKAAESVAETKLDKSELSWKYDADSKTLTVKGDGVIPNFETAEAVAWHGVRHSVEKIVLDGEITAIGNYAFYYFPKLTEIKGFEKVTKIGKCSFAFCSSLTSMTVPTGVTEIGESCFEGCEQLKAISVPNTVTSIGERAFAFCGSLEIAHIMANVSKIEAGIFMSCRSLNSLTFSEKIKELKGDNIAKDAFDGCPEGISFEKANFAVNDSGKVVVTIKFVDATGNPLEGKETITKEYDPTVIHEIDENTVPKKIGDLKLDEKSFARKRDKVFFDDITLTAKYIAANEESTPTTPPADTNGGENTPADGNTKKFGVVETVIAIVIFVLVIAGIVVFAIFMVRSTKKAKETAGKPVRKDKADKNDAKEKRYNKDPKKRK